MSVTTPIFRPGFWAKLGAALVAAEGATEAGAVDGAVDGAETDEAGVGGTAVALPVHAETIRAIPASTPKPLVRMRIVPPQTRGAVRVRSGVCPWIATTAGPAASGRRGRWSHPNDRVGQRQAAVGERPPDPPPGALVSSLRCPIQPRSSSTATRATTTPWRSP